MGQLKKILFVLIISLFFCVNVKAESNCSNQEQAELNKIVANVKTSYEEGEATLDTEEYPLPDEVLSADNPSSYTSTYNYFKISITNITEKIYAVVSNDYNDEVLTFNSSNTTNGVALINWELIDRVTTFTIKIYANDLTGCSGELYKTLYITTPRFNEYFFYEACNDAPDFEMCQKYVTFKDVDLDTFMTKLDKYLAKNKKKDEEKTKDSFFEKNKIEIIIGGTVLVAALGVGTFVLIRRKRSSEL